MKKVKKIEFADSTQVVRRAETLDRVIRSMGEIADTEWTLANCFVSDLSSVGDFLRDDVEAKVLSEKLGVAVKRGDLLIDVALQMEQKN